MRAAFAALVSVAMGLLLAACGEPPRQSQVAPTPEEATDFHELYSKNCAGCHGPSGTKGGAPRLNDPLYLAVADTQSLHNTIKYGRKGTPMPGFGKEDGGNLSDRQIDAIVDGMQREWARPVDFHGAVAPTYAVEKAPQGDPARGQSLYQRNCMMCHGFGRFKGTAGAIVDPNYLALVSDQGLRTTIIVGRMDWGMPDWQHRIPNHAMSDQDISDVVAWLATQRPHYSDAGTQAGTPAPHTPAPTISTSRGQGQSAQGK